MNVLLFLALCASAFLALRRDLFSSTAERLVAAFLLVFVEILTIVRFAGALHALTPAAIIAGTLAVISAHALLYKKSASTVPSRDIARPLFGAPARWLWPAAIGVALFYAWRLILGRLLPPNWDALTYHLPRVWRWMGERSFDQTGSGLSRIMNFPQNGERVMAWFALAGGGALEPARVAQALAVPLFGASAFVLGERGAGRAWAWPVTLAALSAPIVLIQAGEAYVDIFYAAFWLAALAGLVILATEPSRAGWAIVAAGVGLAAGTKETLYFLLPLAAAAAVVTLLRSDRRPTPAAWAGLLALLLWTGSGFYVRNWTTHGNPFWPYQLTLGPFVLFSGLDPHRIFNSFDFQGWFVSSTWRWLLYPFQETIKGTVKYSTENGFGALFAAGWALLPFATLRAVRTRGTAAILLLAVVAAEVVLFLTVQPSRVPRYVLFLAVPVVVLLASSMMNFTGRARTAALVLWSVGIFLNVALTTGSLLAEPGVAMAWQSFRRTGGYDADAYLAARYGAIGEGWAALNHVLKAGDVVVVNDTRLLLPWTGLPSRARVDVVLPHITDDDGFTGASTATGWLDALDRDHAGALVLCRPRWGYSDVHEQEAIVAAHPERFQRLGRWNDEPFGEVTIYAVRRAER